MRALSSSSSDASTWIVGGSRGVNPRLVLPGASHGVPRGWCDASHSNLHWASPAPVQCSWVSDVPASGVACVGARLTKLTRLRS